MMMFTENEIKVIREALADYKNKCIRNSEAVTVATRDGITLLEIYQEKFKTAMHITSKIEFNGSNTEN